MIIYKKLCIFIFLLLLSGCNIIPGMQNPNLSEMQTIPSDQHHAVPVLIPITSALIKDQRNSMYFYQIAPSDILDITIWRHPEFALKEVRANQNSNSPSKQGAAGQDGLLVDPKGYIHYPLIGYVFVAGKTVDQVRKEMTSKLNHFIKNPSLNVRVVDFRGKKTYVLGEVKKPGFLPLNDQPLSITDAIVLSGGFDSNAADPTHIYVIRGPIDRPTVYWLNAKTPEALLLAEQFYLLPNDILFVSSAAATRWNRVLNQLLPTIQTVWYTKAIMDQN